MNVKDILAFGKDIPLLTDQPLPGTYFKADSYTDASLYAYLYIKMLKAFYYSHPLVNIDGKFSMWGTDKNNGIKLLHKLSNSSIREITDESISSYEIDEFGHVVTAMFQYLNESPYWNYFNYQTIQEDENLSDCLCLTPVGGDEDGYDEEKYDYVRSDTPAVFSISAEEWSTYIESGKSEHDYLMGEFSSMILGVSNPNKDVRNIMPDLIPFFEERNSYLDMNIISSALIPFWNTFTASDDYRIKEEDKDVVKVLEKAMSTIELVEGYTWNYGLAPSLFINNQNTFIKIFTLGCIDGCDSYLNELSLSMFFPIAVRLVDECILCLNEKYHFLPKEFSVKSDIVAK